MGAFSLVFIYYILPKKGQIILLNSRTKHASIIPSEEGAQPRRSSVDEVSSTVTDVTQMTKHNLLSSERSVSEKRNERFKSLPQAPGSPLQAITSAPIRGTKTVEILPQAPETSPQALKTALQSAKSSTKAVKAVTQPVKGLAKKVESATPRVNRKGKLTLKLPKQVFKLPSLRKPHV